MTTELPRLLLVCETHPDYRAVGGILLCDFLKHYPHDRICIFCPHKIDIQPQRLHEHQDIAIRSIPVPAQRMRPHRRRRLQHFVTWLRFRFSYVRQLDELKTEAVLFGASHNVDLVWVVLNGFVSIDLAVPVAKALKRPLVTTVWDDPRDIAVGLGVHRRTARFMQREFGDVQRFAQRCTVISKPMQALYQQRYGVDSIILRHALPSCTWQSHGEARRDNDCYTIGFAGSLIADDAFNAFTDALDLMNWQVNERRITLRILTNRITLTAAHATHIEYLGWRSVGESVKILADADISYLPQTFSRRRDLSATLAFPTKLSTYLAAGRPVLLHTPDNSSLTAFFAEFRIGALCATLDPGVIASALTKLLADSSLRDVAVSEIGRARVEEFNDATTRKRLAWLIGASEDQLGEPPRKANASGQPA